MSVQEEHLSAAASLSAEEAKEKTAEKALHAANVPPQLEYAQPSQDSLAMLGAAIGGALLGVFLTLLVLAIVNRGTLLFNTGPQVSALEETVAAVNDNVGAVSANLDILAGRIEGIQSQTDSISSEMGTAQSLLAEVGAELSSQGESVTKLNQAVSVLDVSRQKFDVFTGALNAALSEMNSIGAPAAEAAPAEGIAPGADAGTIDAATAEDAPVVEAEAATADAATTEEAPAAEPKAATVDAATTEDAAPAVEADAATTEDAAPAAEADAATAEDAAPAAEVVVETDAVASEALPEMASVTASPDVAADAIAVLFFADANQDGVKDSDEASMIGVIVTLTDGSGEMIAASTTTEEGAIFAELAAGEYTLTGVDGVEIATVTVVEGEAEGQMVLVPVVE